MAMSVYDQLIAGFMNGVLVFGIVWGFLVMAGAAMVTLSLLTGISKIAGKGLRTILGWLS